MDGTKRWSTTALGQHNYDAGRPAAPRTSAHRSRRELAHGSRQGSTAALRRAGEAPPVGEGGLSGRATPPGGEAARASCAEKGCPWSTVAVTGEEVVEKENFG